MEKSFFLTGMYWAFTGAGWVRDGKYNTLSVLGMLECKLLSVLSLWIHIYVMWKSAPGEKLSAEGDMKKQRTEHSHPLHMNINRQWRRLVISAALAAQVILMWGEISLMRNVTRAPRMQTGMYIPTSGSKNIRKIQRRLEVTKSDGKRRFRRKNCCNIDGSYWLGFFLPLGCCSVLI